MLRGVMFFIAAVPIGLFASGASAPEGIPV